MNLYTSVIIYTIINGCISSKVSNNSECSTEEQHMFSSCLDAGCSSTYSQDMSGADNCDISGGGSVVSVRGGIECAFTSSGSCFVICDCPDGTDIEVTIGLGEESDTSSRSNDDTALDTANVEDDDTATLDTATLDSGGDVSTGDTSVPDSGLSLEDDWDRDGFTESEGDCDDSKSSINPYATDTAGDSTDQNCDGVDGVDMDYDGFASTLSGGNDCDDTDPGIYVGSDDIKSDGVDSNCDGDDEDEIRFKNIYTFPTIGSDSFDELNYIGDLDGDGYTDVLVTMYGSGTYPKYYISGSSIKSKTQNYFKFSEASYYGPDKISRLSIKDYNKDGYMDVMADSYLFDGLDLSSGVITKSLKACGNASGQDSNFDGYEDVFIVGSYYYYMNNIQNCISGTISLSSPLEYYSKIESVIATSGYRTYSNDIVDIGDCDLDGYDEFLYSAMYYVSYGTYNRYIYYKIGGTTVASSGYIYNSERSHDRDLDGKSEQLIQISSSSAGMYRCYSAGSYNTEIIDTSIFASSSYHGDINGDFISDYIIYYPSTTDFSLRISDSSFYDSPNEYTFDAQYFSWYNKVVIGNWDSDADMEVLYVDTSGKLNLADIDI